MTGAEGRIEAVLRALARLGAREAGPLGEGLGAECAREGLAAAVGMLTAEGLRAELASVPGPLPAGALLVCAGGVFTAPIEWAALLAAAGVRLWVKPARSAPALPRALVEELSAEGLPVALHEGHAPPDEAPVIVAFGSDGTLRALAEGWPDRRLVGYGHAWSAALWAPSLEGQNIRHQMMIEHARDLWLYDGRGCMAPTALFTTDDPALVESALYEALQQAEGRWPTSPLPPALGPVLRERAGLARVRGRARLGGGFGVLTLPAEHFRPLALGRYATIHPVARLDEVEAALQGWPGLRSTLGVGGEGAAIRGGLGFSRVCPLGSMQTPPFPRAHDGRPMLGAIAEADDGPRLRA